MKTFKMTVLASLILSFGASVAVADNHYVQCCYSYQRFLGKKLYCESNVSDLLATLDAGKKCGDDNGVGAIFCHFEGCSATN